VVVLAAVALFPVLGLAAELSFFVLAVAVAHEPPMMVAAPLNLKVVVVEPVADHTMVQPDAAAAVMLLRTEVEPLAVGDDANTAVGFDSGLVLM